MEKWVSAFLKQKQQCWEMKQILHEETWSY